MTSRYRLNLMAARVTLNQYRVSQIASRSEKIFRRSSRTMIGA
jgi:hypothetical protein